MALFNIGSIGSSISSALGNFFNRPTSGSSQGANALVGAATPGFTISPKGTATSTKIAAGQPGSAFLGPIAPGSGLFAPGATATDLAPGAASYFAEPGTPGAAHLGPIRPALPSGGTQQFSVTPPTFLGGGGGSPQTINPDAFQASQIGFTPQGGAQQFQNLRDQQIQSFQGIANRFGPTRGQDEEEEEERLPLQPGQLGPLAPGQLRAQGPIQRLPLPSDVSQPSAENLVTEPISGDETSVDDIDAQIDMGLVNKATQAPPLPAEPVVPTPEQQAFEQQNPQMRFDLDNARRTAGLPQMETQRAQIMQQMNDINALFTEIIDDVKANPELPKSLALRRINKIQESQKLRIMQLQGTLEILNTQIGDANDLVDQQFGIAKFEADEENRRIDNDRQTFSMFGESISTFSPEQQIEWAKRLGVSPADMSKMVKGAADADLDLKYSTGNGVMTAVNAKTGEIEWTVNTGTGTSTTTHKFTATQLAKGASAAGISLEEFKALDPDTQNSFINPLQEAGIPDSSFADIARGYVKALNKDDAISQIESGTISVNGKTLQLSERQKTAIISSIETQYPKGRTFFQKILPKGK